MSPSRASLRLSTRWSPTSYQALSIEEQHRPGDSWPIRTAQFFAAATAESSLEVIQGFGSGTTPELARLRAVMECAERYAQFGQVAPPIAAVAPFDSLGQDAISPHACGLYSPRQYATPGFGLQPFSERTPIEWLATSDLETGVGRLLPVEFLYPRASLTRPRIVMESSSGTAAHTSPEAATLAALCEVIERDCLLLFWYRRPPTAAATIDALDAPGLQEDLRRIQARGFVVTVCSLTYDLDVPCFLDCGDQGRCTSVRQRLSPRSPAGTYARGHGTESVTAAADGYARIHSGRPLILRREHPERSLRPLQPRPAAPDFQADARADLVPCRRSDLEDRRGGADERRPCCRVVDSDAGIARLAGLLLRPHAASPRELRRACPAGDRARLDSDALRVQPSSSGLSTALGYAGTWPPEPPHAAFLRLTTRPRSSPAFARTERTHGSPIMPGPVARLPRKPRRILARSV